MKTILTVFGCFLSILIFSQVAGNALYGNNSYSNLNSHNQVFEKLKNGFSFSEDSHSINYQVKIMHHILADYYIVTLGVNQEGNTVENCNRQINERIQNLITHLKTQLNLKDIYIDFIAQVPIYDYSLEKQGENQYNGKQHQKGFELKKNLLIKLKNINDLEMVLELASKEEIYNLINVEYYNDSMESIYDEMISEAKKLFEKKEKQRILFDVQKEEFEDIQVSIEKFSVQPISMYEDFRAFETSEVSLKSSYNYPANYIQQELRKSQSFYFKPYSPGFFDLVMNEQTPTVGIQYVVIATIKKVKKEKPKEPKVYHFITPNGDLKSLELN